MYTLFMLAGIHLVVSLFAAVALRLHIPSRTKAAIQKNSVRLNGTVSRRRLNTEYNALEFALSPVYFALGIVFLLTLTVATSARIANIDFVGLNEFVKDKAVIAEAEGAPIIAKGFMAPESKLEAVGHDYLSCGIYFLVFLLTPLFVRHVYLNAIKRFDSGATRRFVDYYRHDFVIQTCPPKMPRPAPPVKC